MYRQPGAAGSLLPEARRLPPDQKERAGEAGIQARHRSLTLTYQYRTHKTVGIYVQYGQSIHLKKITGGVIPPLCVFSFEAGSGSAFASE
jgi:hypothetical protein